MPSPADVRRALPSIDDIADDELRRKVIDAWTLAAEESGTEDLASVQWSVVVQSRLNLPEVTLVEHLRTVATVAGTIAGALESRGVELSRDLITAGVLLQDVGKLYEYDGSGETAIGDLVGHPYYGVYVVGAADLPPELTHVVLSHSSLTNVDPANLEAEIVRRADQIGVASILAANDRDLRDA